MGLSILFPLVLCTIVLSLCQVPTNAAKQSYIVYMGEHSFGLTPTLFDVERVQKSHYKLLASLSQSNGNVQDQIFYSYTRCINGFAAVLDDAQVQELQKHPEVVTIFPNKERKLHTTHSWDFLGYDGSKGVSNSIWKKARFGRGVIIGNLDTGVWPEDPSFNDKGYGPVPARWRGVCQPNSGVTCNRKLIGARYFNKGYALGGGSLSSPIFNTARDTEGHGSHTLSTAGGSFVRGASLFGAGNGTARGGSPKARVAAYKVCWPADSGGCYDADILAGFDAAIADGVDVISVSLGGLPQDFYNEATSLGAFHAIRKNIIVVASAGNDGPAAGLVTNGAPWLLTVGASSMDREFATNITLGSKKIYKGLGLSDKALPVGKFYPLINAADAALPTASAADAQLCKNGTLDPKKVLGKIVLCIRGENGRVQKGQVLALAGAVGMILANPQENGNELLSDPHFLPASHISYNDGQAVISYISSNIHPTATIAPVKTLIGTKPAPVMAAFSSRGPSIIEPSILKPDITAPGVDVIAAYTQAVGPSESDSDKRRVPFITMSGTSMSCPHVSGIVGLLKAIHKDWSPAAIKSAIMTTATIQANDEKAILDSTGQPATPFAYGAGHVQPNLAADPGLVYDLTVDDYLNFLCARGYNETQMRGFSIGTYACPKNFSLLDLNYPSITVPALKGTLTVNRKVKNVGTPGTYIVSVKPPASVSVVVEPTSLKFTTYAEEKPFKITFTPTTNGMPKNYEFGQLIWSDGKHHVRSPIVVKQA